MEEQHRHHFQPISIQLSHVLDVIVTQSFKVVTFVGEEAQGTLTVAETKRQQNLVSLRVEPIEKAFEFHKIFLSVRTCDNFFLCFVCLYGGLLTKMISWHFCLSSTGSYIQDYPKRQYCT